MNRAILSDASPSVKLIFAALVVVGTWFVFQIIAVTTGMVIFSVSMENALDIMQTRQNPDGVAFLKYVQGITATGLFIVSSLIIAYFLDTSVTGYLYLDRIPNRFYFVLVALLTISILPFTNLLTEINGLLQLPEFLNPVQKFFTEKEAQMEEIMRSFLDVRGIGAFLVNVLIIAVIPAIGEELLFRGVFQRLFISLTKNAHVGIFITAFLFSALHLQFLSFLPRMVLGVLFGYLVLWSKSLWPAILAHFLNNSLALAYYHLLYSGKIEVDLEHLGTPGHSLYIGLLSMVISAVLFFSIYKFNKKVILRY